MNPQQLTREYLQKAQVMQLATVSDGQPWICNIHFVPAESGTLYWCSSVDRRHSKEIETSKKAAVAVAVKSPEHPVVGIQIEGDASLVQGAELEKAVRLYDERYEISKEFYEQLSSSKGMHRMYKFVPRVVVLFDEENFPKDPRKEWRATG